MEELPEFEEEEEEGGREDWLRMVRLEVIDYILHRHGLLRAPDIARILGWKVQEVNHVLHQLEDSGRVKRMKLGRKYVWSPVEESHLIPMYY